MDFARRNPSFSNLGASALNFKIISLNKKNRHSWAASLQELESKAIYPLGADFFKIDHGQDYFAFFDRMGEPHFHLAVHENQVVACAAGVLRNLNWKGSTKKVWYLCDLKVHPQFRGHHLPGRLLKKNLFQNYFKCSRTYAISMNPNGGENPVVRIIQKMTWIPIRPVHTLNFFNLNHGQALSACDLLRPSPQFISLSKKKDLILQSSGRAMQMLHAQFDENGIDHPSPPQKDFDHLFCAIENTSRCHTLKKWTAPFATATVLSHRMSFLREPEDWNFILSSDI